VKFMVRLHAGEPFINSLSPPYLIALVPPLGVPLESFPQDTQAWTRSKHGLGRLSRTCRSGESACTVNCRGTPRKDHPPVVPAALACWRALRATPSWPN
jgi:hypothetical protein